MEHATLLNESFLNTYFFHRIQINYASCPRTTKQVNSKAFLLRGTVAHSGIVCCFIRNDRIPKEANELKKKRGRKDYLMVDFENIFNNLALRFSFLSLLIQPSFFVWKMSMLDWIRYKRKLSSRYSYYVFFAWYSIQTNFISFLSFITFYLNDWKSTENVQIPGKGSVRAAEHFWSECVFWRIF